MIPVFEPQFAGNERLYLDQCIETGWVSSEGPFVKRFEEQMASRFGMPHAVAVSSGTSALEVALYAMNLPAGAEVILPAFTIISCVTACLRLKLNPVLVDVLPGCLTLDPTMVKARITRKTGAIMAVDIFGNAPDMDALEEISLRTGVPIIEDFAEAHGASHISRDGRTRVCGSLGHISACSFYANKIISCGEGGMVLAKTAEQADRARSYRNLCFDKARKYIHENIGYNYRMTNLQAALGLAQLEQLDATVAQKRKVGDWYAQAFSGVKGVVFHPVPSYSNPVYWMFGIQLDPATGIDAEQLGASLAKNKIGWRHFFCGMHRQPAFQRENLFIGESYPVTDLATRHGVLLPSSCSLTQPQITTIATAVREAIENHGQ